MAVYKTLVCTTAGNTLLDGESKTYLRVSGNSFVRQKAKNLKRGNMILFHKEYVDKTLGEVEEYLMQEDDRYVEAKERIFERNRNGIYVTRLRTGLWRGASNRIRNAYSNLEEKIVLETDDFDQNDYREMNRIIYTSLERDHQRGGPEPVVYSTRMNWLKDTMAPADWSMFRALATINQDFEEFYNDFRTSNENAFSLSSNLYNAYKLLVGIRQGIMRYIARRKGHGEGGGVSSRGNRRLSLEPEIDIVLRYVIDEIDDQRIAVAVTDVRRIEYQIGVGHDTRGIKLSSGVLTDKERPRDINVKTLLDIVVEEDIISEYIDISLYKYMKKRCYEEGIAGNLEELYVMAKVDGFITNHIGFNKKRPTKIRMKQKVRDSLIKRKAPINEERKSLLDSIADKLAQEVVKGPNLVSDPNKKFVLPLAIRFEAERIKRFPKEFHEFYELSDKINSLNLTYERLRETKKRLRELRRILVEDYGCNPDERTQKVTAESIKNFLADVYVGEHGEIPSFSPSEWDRMVKDCARDDKVILFTQEEEREVVKQYGFEELLDLSWI